MNKSMPLNESSCKTDCASCPISWKSLGNDASLSQKSHSSLSQLKYVTQRLFFHTGAELKMAQYTCLFPFYFSLPALLQGHFSSDELLIDSMLAIPSS